jgi:hypothetical protein
LFSLLEGFSREEFCHLSAMIQDAITFRSAYPDLERYLVQKGAGREVLEDLVRREGFEILVLHCAAHEFFSSYSLTKFLLGPAHRPGKRRTRSPEERFSLRLIGERGRGKKERSGESQDILRMARREVREMEAKHGSELGRILAREGRLRRPRDAEHIGFEEAALALAARKSGVSRDAFRKRIQRERKERQGTSAHREKR